MIKLAKYLLIAVVLLLFLTRENICNHIGFGQQKLHTATTDAPTGGAPKPETPAETLQTGPEKLRIQPGDPLWYWDNARNKYVQDGIYDPQAEAQKPIVHLLPPGAAPGPVKLLWPMLDQVRYSPKYAEAVMGNMYVPLFSPAIQELEGKLVELAGYVIPFDESGKSFVLSYNVFAACFFCGKGSPTSIVSVFLKQPTKYNTDDFRAFQGYLRLNYDDPDEFYYMLDEAREVSL